MQDFRHLYLLPDSIIEKRTWDPWRLMLPSWGSAPWQMSLMVRRAVNMMDWNEPTIVCTTCIPVHLKCSSRTWRNLSGHWHVSRGIKDQSTYLHFFRTTCLCLCLNFAMLPTTSQGTVIFHCKDCTDLGMCGLWMMSTDWHLYSCYELINANMWNEKSKVLLQHREALWCLEHPPLIILNKGS